MKRDALDALFSTYIRTRDRWRCQRCGTFYAPPTQALHCAHFFSRGRYSVRFDPDNAAALCYDDHRFLDQRPLEKEKFARHFLGDDCYERLLFRAHHARSAAQVRLQRTASRVWLTAELKRLNGELAAEESDR